MRAEIKIINSVLHDESLYFKVPDRTCEVIKNNNKLKQLNCLI
jgi:hypothetical protein